MGGTLGRPIRKTIPERCMSVIINPRGSGGAGKSEFARRIMALYGWSGRDGTSGTVEPVYRKGRLRPVSYRLRHPAGGRPLAVIGHYEARSGGCDTIGDLNEIFDVVADNAAAGCDVLFEGLLVSSEVARTVRLASAFDLHVLCLDTPFEESVHNFIRRRRARRDIRASIAANAAIQYRRVRDACSRLESHTRVMRLPFDDAFRHASALLGVDRAMDGIDALPDAAGRVSRSHGGECELPDGSRR